MPEDRIKGSVICRCQDEYGEIIVAEEGNKRTLYFGEGIMQSTIQTDRPDLLLEDYNEAMMSGLIFKSSPESVLLIGLERAESSFDSGTRRLFSGGFPKLPCSYVPDSEMIMSDESAYGYD